MENEIFRKVALARLSSPEQLDQMLRVATPRSWLALAGLFLLVGAATVWGCTGTIATKAIGNGVIIRTGHVLNVSSEGSGRVLEVRVEAGETVSAGQIVATVAQPALLERIRLAELQLSDARRDAGRLVGGRQESARLEVQSLQRQKANVRLQIGETEAQSRVVQDQIPANEELLAKGLITRQQVYSIKEKLASLQEGVATLHARLVQLDANRSQTEDHLAQVSVEHERRVADSSRNLELLQQELDTTSKVVNPHSGRVLEIKVVAGTVIGPGTPIASIQPAVNVLDALVYVPAVRAKEIRPGMEVEIVPSSVKVEEYGFIRGIVRSVAEYPATEGSLMRTFDNAPLVQSVASGGPVNEIRVEMFGDASTPSGYRWSSRAGPPMPVTSGTLCTGSIITRRQAPIRMMFPAIKRLAGGP